MGQPARGKNLGMDFKKLMNKAGNLAKQHSGKLGPLGKKAAGLLGNKTDNGTRKAKRNARRRSRSARFSSQGNRQQRPAMHRPR